MKSFIVRFWARIFDFLSYGSAFRLFVAVLPTRWKGYGVIEIWALGNLFASVLSLAAASLVNPSFVELPLLGYALIRIFEVTVYQINVVFFDAYRWAKAGGQASPLKGYRRLVILILQNYVEMIFWFGLVYFHFANHFETIATSAPATHELRTFLGATYQSVITMATLGPNVGPKDDIGRIITILHIAVGVFIGIVVLGTVIGLLPQRASLDQHFGNPEDAT